MSIHVGVKIIEKNNELDVYLDSNEFYYKIISSTKEHKMSFFERELLDLADFLTEREVDIFSSQCFYSDIFYHYDNEYNYENMYEYSICPLEFKQIFIKLYNYLKNDNKLPLTHYIVKRNNDCFFLDDNITINFDNIDYGISGDTYYYDEKDYIEHREDLKISHYNSDKKEIKDWVKAQPEIAIFNQKLLIKTKSKFDLYKEFMEEVIKLCDIAIERKKRIIWYFSH